MKMTPQRFCLRWNNHQSNMLSVFDQLLHEDQFTDVTLAVDGRYLTAHRMVLSACSPYFNALFINHPEKHPIVILKDVPYADMKALLDFMYRGEVSVDQERLTAFLRVAESLRIKGLTEVNDDKPSGGNTHNNEPTPQPPQLQRIQPYVVQQQQQRQKLSHQSANSVNSSNIAANSTPQPPFSQQQQSLLSSALASMPKRKRGRPRKLSGSSNGDYDEFEREGGLDSEMGDSKMCNDSYSGNDDGSDDNQRDPGHNDDLNESRDSVPPAKKSKPVKDTRSQQPQQHQQQQQQQQDDSTSVQLIAPELSQRLFGSNKMITISNTSSTTPATSPAAAIHTPAKHAMITLVSQQQQQQQPQQSHLTTVKDLNEANVKGHLAATGLGLKVKTTLQTAMQAITTNTSSVAGNPNSLLKQQLRAGLRIDFNDAAPTTNALPNVQSPANVHETHEACSALQSLANVAERQAQNHIQPPTANNLHHQFLLHMAANPMLKQTGEYFQQQQQQTRLLLREEENNIDLLMDQSDKSDPEMLTLADENAGLDYSASTENIQRSDKNENQESSNNNNTNINQDNGTMKSEKSKNNTRSKNSAGKPIQRRRIRRKAQSTIDDQAEQLTEMSVRGLDLFRYASINEGVYQCTECAKENMQKTFKNKYSFQRHAFLYHEGKHRKVFPCPLCGKEFSRPDKMKNHMKMTHESFVSKEIQSFNPLNYLITAAASGEIQATFPQLPRPPPSQATSVANNITATSGQKQSSDNNGTQLNVLIGNNNDLKEGMTLTNMQDSKKVAKDVMMMAETDNFKFPTDIEIKNEIIISPSPSPPPTSLLPSVSMSLSSHSTLQQSTAVSFSFSDSLNLLKTASTAPSAQAAQMQNAQRLEEVK